MLRLVSWNVNGIRAVMRRGFTDIVADQAPDILCVQETKAHPEQVDLDLPGYHQLWNPAERRGYSGTAVFTRLEPRQVRYGLGIEAHDREGRVIAVEHAAFWLVNVYTPNAQRDLARLTYRTTEWDVAFRDYICQLATAKPVVFCGDLNVAHQEIDLANPRSNRRNAGFTDEERTSFSETLASGFCDTYRTLYPDTTGAYSWWSYRPGVRERNIGWRIDYFCVSQPLMDRVRDASILPEIYGSDHCPVALDLAVA